MKKFIIILLYIISMLFVAGGLWKFFLNNEDMPRREGLDYRIEQQPLPTAIKKVLEGYGFYNNRNTKVSIIFFLRPNVCSICNLEITEFSKFLLQKANISNNANLFVFDTKSNDMAKTFMNSIGLSVPFLINPSDDLYDFLSIYGLRELVGQMVIIDLQKNSVIARVIIESTRATKPESKIELIEEILNSMDSYQY